jgi:uncharacterized protein
MSSRLPSRIRIRRSSVHGRGVYAVGPFADGERIIEYKGERISSAQASERHPANPDNPTHTFYFSLSDGQVIDGNHGGNSARWINHACAPNCEANEVDGRVFIHALRDIEPGEELFYDYRLGVDERVTAKLKREYACCCGATNCRGTMLLLRGK